MKKCRKMPKKTKKFEFKKENSQSTPFPEPSPSVDGQENLNGNKF